MRPQVPPPGLQCAGLIDRTSIGVSQHQTFSDPLLRGLPDTSLDAACRNGDVVLTVNNRLARHLRTRYEQAQASHGHAAWETPLILPWTSWLQRVHEELLDLGSNRRRTLSATQERLVWEQVIRASDTGRDLMRADAAGVAAASAYRLLVEWGLDRRKLAAEGGGETAAFLAWLDGFEALCRRHGWQVQAELPVSVGAALERGDWAAPSSLALAGFHELSPLQGRLLAHLRDAGTRVQRIHAPAGRAMAQRTRLRDPVDEAEAVARWARRRLAEAPRARIGIVVPDLAERRGPLADRLRRALQPEQLLPGAVRTAPSFEFSLGLPLAEQPLVSDGLTALALAGPEISWQDASRFLRSPFFAGGPAAWPAGSALDRRLRAARRATTTPAQLARLFARTAAQADGGSFGRADAFARFHRQLPALPSRASPSMWAGVFDRLLGALGWPGERSLDSREFQAARRLRELLLEFAGLDAVAGERSFPGALALLRRLATDTLFQGEGGDPPVEVLGLLEADGLEFDHVWILGLDDEHWPSPASPHPLLPAGLQRRLGLPHASAERERHFAFGLLERLRKAAPEVVGSFAARDGDRSLRPSPLIAHWPSVEAADLGADRLPDPWSAAPPADLETLEDCSAPPAPLELRGGSQLLAAQALCPFSAVARFRLAASEPERPCEAPDGRLTGELIHHALEVLWGALGSSAALRAARADGTLAGRIAAAVEQALDAAAAQRPDLYGPNLLALERRRLAGLLGVWLEGEIERAPFTVLHREARDEAVLAGLRLRLRADRIDRLEDGRCVVIDYKTGARAGPGDWTGPRITEPQVPLYAVTGGLPVAATLIGKVRAGKCGWSGSAAEDGIVPGVAGFAGTGELPDWPALLGHWTDRLSELAAEVGRGVALATPSRDACAYCAFPVLCRKAEAADVESADDD
jgi:probable DNA repair protein